MIVALFNEESRWGERGGLRGGDIFPQSCFTHVFWKFFERMEIFGRYNS